LLAASVLVLLALPAGGADTPADAFRTKIEKWVETRQLVSQEKSEWDAEQESLRATRDLLKQQKQALAAEIAALQETSTVADEEREDLLIRRDEAQRSAATLQAEIRAMEEAVLALAPRLPDPLREKLELLLVQIPDDPETTRLGLGARLMNVLGVLAQAEKFNDTATFVGETRPVDGQQLQVRTLYWGLGQAFYVDSQGRTAGVGHPGADGWQFTNEPELADDAELLLDIYEGNVDVIEFVPLPVQLH